MKRRFEIEWKDNEITEEFELVPESLRDILNKELRFTTFTVTKLSEQEIKPKKKLEKLEPTEDWEGYLRYPSKMMADKINEIVDRIRER